MAIQKAGRRRKQRSYHKGCRRLVQEREEKDVGTTKPVQLRLEQTVSMASDFLIWWPLPIDE